MKKISIIVIVFNVESYIMDALDSIVRQTIGLEHLEVIMVDDCSTDNSGKIIDEYANKYENFISIHLPENSGGCGKPRNVGIEKATGEYLMFLDSDDYYADDACEVLYNKIKDNNADIVFSRYIYLLEDHLQKNYSPFGETTEIKVKRINEDPRLLKIPPSVWTKIYKRTFITDKNLKFLEGIHAEDLVFTLNAFLEANGIIYLNDHFSYFYRIRDSDEDSSISRSKDKKNLLGLVKGFYKANELLNHYGKKEYFPTLFIGHLQFWADAFIISNTTYSEKKELLEEINFLFEEFNKFNIKPSKKYLIPLFDTITNKRYDESIRLVELLKNFIDNQKKLENKRKRLQIQLNTENEKMAEFLKISGYFKYKINNISTRLKIKFKKRLIELRSVKNVISGFNPWIKYDKLTLILPYRKTEDKDRELNLDITLKFYSKIGIKNLIISEHSDKSSKDYLYKKYAHLFKFFKVCTVIANGQLFNKAKAINNGVLESRTPYFAIVDIDCITKKGNINKALKLLKEGYEVVHPFDRKVTDIINKEIFQKNFDFNTIQSPVQGRPWADGGIVFWNKNSFINIGMKNENFSGWGGEDNEIMLRAQFFNLKSYRIDDTLYHLYHYRPQKRTQNNAEELEKTRQMKDKEVCLKEINRWPWVINAKRSLNNGIIESVDQKLK